MEITLIVEPGDSRQYRSLRFAEKHGFDFIVVTDHNTTSQNDFSFDKPDLMVIPGMELSTHRGHMNFLGVKEPIEEFRVLDEEGLERQIATAHERGALAVLNHPFKPPSVWEYGYEVWNGPWSSCNLSALRWWQDRPAAGERIVAVGGSDSHGSKKAYALNDESSHQIPTTWINSESRSVQGLLDNIRKGHLFITYVPDCPFIDLKGPSGGIMGDPAVDGKAEILVMSLRKSDIVKIVSEDGCPAEKTRSCLFESEAPIPGRSFLRVEVWRKIEIILDENRDLVIRDRAGIIRDPEEYVMAFLSNPL
jgi:hypothetical protein